MTIGILKEIAGERRVSLLPESVATLVKMNVTMLIESGAGMAAFASDEDYIAAGAKIDSRQNVIANSELLIKINQPVKEEIDLMKEGKEYHFLQPGCYSAYLACTGNGYSFINGYSCRLQSRAYCCKHIAEVFPDVYDGCRYN